MATQTAPSRASQTRARERARLQLAEKQAAARAREKANQTDLAAFFTAAEQVDTADEAHRAAMDAARRTYDDTVAGARTTQAQHLRAMADRGETVADLADLTGLTASEVRRALRAAPAGTADETPADNTTGGETRPATDEPPAPS